jgi:hypothetical protein
MLAQIRAGGPRPFTAGIVLHDDVVVEAAPIVSYMKGWARAKVRYYCGVKRGWDVIVVQERELP